MLNILKLTFFISFTIILFCDSLSEAGPYGRGVGGGGVSGSGGPIALARSGVGNSHSNAQYYVGKRNSNLMNAGMHGGSPDAASNLNGANSKGAGGSVAFSAWGLILIIITVIIAGFALYYGIICYPILCRSEKNYDIVDGLSTTSGVSFANYSSRSATPNKSQE